MWPFRSEDCFYFIALVFTQQAVIYEYAGQLVSDCFGKHNSCYGGIDSAGQCAEDFSVAYFFTDRFDGVLLRRQSMCQSPAQSADIVSQSWRAFLFPSTGVQNFWMELGCIELFFSTFCNGCYRTVMPYGLMISNPGADLRNVIEMAHPADGFFGYVLQTVRKWLSIGQHLSFSIFSDIGATFYFTTEHMHHQLCSIAECRGPGFQVQTISFV